MLKKSVVIAGFITSFMATSACAGNAAHCLHEGGGKLWNSCNQAVEAAWCIEHNGVRCTKLDNSATIRPGQEFPIDAGHNEAVHYDACWNANSIKRFDGYQSVICN